MSITRGVIALRERRGYPPGMEAASTFLGFGDLLREWRRRRNLSQLELSLNSDVSARHLSFVETGRSKPSRDMVVRLAETLEVPLREQNTLLMAAGYAPLYAERTLESDDMEPVRSALDRFLRAHEPYPALVTDRHHNLLASNDALATVTSGCAPQLLEAPANAIRVALHPEGMAPRTLNLAEWSAHLLARLRREALLSGDPALEELHAEMAAYPGVETELRAEERSAADIVVPLRLADGEDELAFFSTICTFGTPLDVTLSELSIEAFYPVNAKTATRLLQAL
jgi:transcriptional regulator with XRE-family HTH domain